MGLEAEEKTWRLTTDEVIEAAIRNGPADTRGGLRGFCVQKFPDQIQSIQWEQVRFADGLRSRTLDMRDLFDPQEVTRCIGLFKTAQSPADALAAWTHGKDRDV